PPSQGTSRNWSGYATTGGAYTAVSATWTVPQADASGPQGASATWVGIGGVNTTDLIQAGTAGTGLGARHLQYDAWIETLPQASQTITLTIHPGDSVTVSLAETQPGSWLISFRNNTTGQSQQRSVAYTSSQSSAEWIQEARAVGGASCRSTTSAR